MWFLISKLWTVCTRWAFSINSAIGEQTSETEELVSKTFLTDDQNIRAKISFNKQKQYFVLILNLKSIKLKSKFKNLQWDGNNLSQTFSDRSKLSNDSY